MNGTPDPSPTVAGDDGGLGPREAAALLDQARQQARRQFEAAPPWLSLTQAAVALAAYGTIWLSVRGQHPYQGPSRPVVLIVYVLVVVVLRAVITARKRASAGVAGPSRRLRRAETAGLFAVLLARAAATAWLQRA
jgi:hypothetical protein